jgi:CheY-like chemotaxis protein
LIPPSAFIPAHFFLQDVFRLIPGGRVPIGWAAGGYRDASVFRFVEEGSGTKKDAAMKVMIVEPDWHFATCVAGHFEDNGDLVVRETPEDFLDHAIRWRPDMVLLSAELASSETLQALRAPRPRPVVLLTEHMSRFDRAWSAWQIGGDELLMKPVLHERELQEAVVSARQNAMLDPHWQRRPRAQSA